MMLSMADRKKSDKVSYRQVNIRFNEVVVAKMEKLGESLGLDMPQMVRRAVEEYIQRREPHAPISVNQPNRR